MKKIIYAYHGPAYLLTASITGFVLKEWANDMKKLAATFASAEKTVRLTVDASKYDRNDRRSGPQINALIRNANGITHLKVRHD